VSTLEKLLVLGVLVLVGVILAISLFWTREDAGLAGLSDPLSATALTPTNPPPTSNAAAPGLPNAQPGIDGTPLTTVAPPPLVVAAPAAVVTPSPHVRPTLSSDFWQYDVQPNDTPVTVSKRLTGTPDAAGMIDRANESKALVPGRSILIPAAVFAKGTSASPIAADFPRLERDVPAAPTAAPAAETSRKPAPAPKLVGSTYVVKRGDNLRRIARMQLKDERRWKEIRDLNKLAGESIREGQTLELPATK